MARPAFPLRLSDPVLRDAVRDVAEHEHLSQNEYIEQAIRHDLVVRGHLRAQQLEALAARLSAVGDDAWAAAVERSLDAFGEGEAGPDPVQMRAMHGRPATAGAPTQPGRRRAGVLERVAAFRTSG